jgi:cation diffusion facilitator family transporter
MHNEYIENWQHRHSFNSDKQHIERKTTIVVAITLFTMVIEILFGWLTNSMALLADGWHMGTHALALGISLLAYTLARKHANNVRFTFGTWKIEILGAYSSALVLGIVAIVMLYTSAERLLHPLSIQYNEAMIVAVLGLFVNLVSAVILNTRPASHSHSHNNPDNSHVHHSHDDLNLKSAYIHVIADAMTSVFAIIALLCAKHFNYNWLDPVMGVVGAGLIARWAFLLLKDSGSILLDHEVDTATSLNIKNIVESDGETRISDLHLWKVADNKIACIISVVTSEKHTIEYYKNKLESIHELAHITVEINESKKLN